MKVLIPFQGMSQYDQTIDAKLQGSACGPTTAAAILKHHENQDYDVNELYRALGTTRIGLFTWRFKKKLNRLGQKRYQVTKTRSMDQVKEELLQGRPVAMKFDRYFSFRWRFPSAYKYHWVPLIGFEERPDDLILFIHDNGKRNRPSKIQAVSYGQNHKVLTFLKIIPTQKD